MKNLPRSIQCLIALLLLFPHMPVAAEDRPYPQIRVTGEGVATLPPDMALLSLAVARDAPTAAKALEETSRAMRDVLAAMRKAGVDEARASAFGTTDC